MMIFLGKCICIGACLCGGAVASKMILDAFIYLETKQQNNNESLQSLQIL